MFYSYIRSFVITVPFMVLVVGVFNYTVDPLNYVRANTNSYFSSERNLKLRMASERNYRGLIIGSSKASYIDTQKSYNITKLHVVVRLVNIFAWKFFIRKFFH